MEADFWKKFFTYTKAEYRGIFTLSIIIVLLIIYNVFGDFSSNKKVDFTNFDNEIAKYKAKKQELLFAKKNKKTYYKKRSLKTQLNLKYFDPNTITKKDWLEIGLKEKQALSILKFIKKIGKFNKAEDINKIYCLSDYEKATLLPYIRITNIQPIETTYSIKKKQIHLELNSVNIEGLLEIKGVGPSTAKAIIKYRNLLGGFYNKTQLNEIYLIDSTRYSQINNSLYVDSEYLIPYLDINKNDYYKLKKHPYIRKVDAYNIIEYRNNYGDFINIEQLKNVHGINDSIYERIYRYFALLK